ncbi:hypothetical protein BH10PAT1_BH10PAT1_0220 [soil metagenome]
MNLEYQDPILKDFGIALNDIDRTKTSQIDSIINDRLIKFAITEAPTIFAHVALVHEYKISAGICKISFDRYLTHKDRFTQCSVLNMQEFKINNETPDRMGLEALLRKAAYLKEINFYIMLESEKNHGIIAFTGSKDKVYVAKYHTLENNGFPLTTTNEGHVIDLPSSLVHRDEKSNSLLSKFFKSKKKQEDILEETRQNFNQAVATLL